MPASAEPELLVDTSAAVALVLADHEHHVAVADALDGAILGLAGHAAFETFAVLTRLPAPLRRTAGAVARLLAARFPATRFLDPAGQHDLHRRLPELKLSGASVYDALVGAAAVHCGVPLATRDQRALNVYRALEVDVRLLG